MTTTCALVVPTRGDRPYLPGIIRAAECPVVVVLTADRDLDVDATIVRDTGPVNIQRWWNHGIDTTDADHIAVFNDDITYPSGLIQQMSDRLTETGAAICYVGTDAPVPCLTGWAFMLDRRIRPDERFRWYYGDNDLHEQALRTPGGCTHVPVRVQHHHPGRSTEGDPALQTLAEEDRRTFDAKWR